MKERMELERPMSEQLVDLHVYVIPPDLWRDQLHSASNEIISEAISAGFLRILPETRINALRDEIAKQMSFEVIPAEYVFLKSVGRCFTRVKPKQEQQIKVKYFLPPHAYCPEIFILEPTAAMKGVLSSDEESFRTPYDEASTTTPRDLPHQRANAKKIGVRDRFPDQAEQRPAKYSHGTNQDSGFGRQSDQLLDRRKPRDTSPLTEIIRKPVVVSDLECVSAQKSIASERNSQASRKQTTPLPQTTTTQCSAPTKDTDILNQTLNTSVRDDRESALIDSGDNKAFESHGHSRASIGAHSTAKHSGRSEKPRSRNSVTFVKSRTRDSCPSEARTEQNDEGNDGGADGGGGGDSGEPLLVDQQQANGWEDLLNNGQLDEEDEGTRPAHRQQDAHAQSYYGASQDDQNGGKSSQSSTTQTGAAANTMRDQTNTMGDQTDDVRDQAETMRDEADDIRRDEEENMDDWYTEQRRVEDEMNYREELDDEKDGSYLNDGNGAREMNADKQGASTSPLRAEEQRTRLLNELSKVREDKKCLEARREELVRRAKHLQAKIQSRRNQARDVWKKRYFDEKKKTPPLEDKCNKLRHELESLHRKIVGQMEGGNQKYPRMDKGGLKPSNQNNLRINATRLNHEIEELQRRVDDAKMKLTGEVKLRNQAESELRLMRADLTQKKIHVTLSRSQKLATLGVPDTRLTTTESVHPTA